MNLIHLEGKLAGVEAIAEKFKQIDGPHKYEFMKTPILKQIDEVSKGMSPEELLNSWQY